jgi:3-dehydroquinate synthase
MDNVVAAVRVGSATGWQSLISRIVSVKSDIVSLDPFEHGERVMLNLGHTLGHALESLSEERTRHDPSKHLSHGEAVGAGMAFSLRLSQRHTGLDAAAHDMMRRSLRDADLWIPPKRWAEAFGPEGIDCSLSHDRLWQLVTHDKKCAGRDSSWVLLSGFGRFADNKKPGTYLTTLSRDDVLSELTAFTRDCRSPERP